MEQQRLALQKQHSSEMESMLEKVATSCYKQRGLLKARNIWIQLLSLTWSQNERFSIHFFILPVLLESWVVALLQFRFFQTNTKLKEIENEYSISSKMSQQVNIFNEFSQIKNTVLLSSLKIIQHRITQEIIHY